MRSIFTLLMLILSAGFLFGQEVQQSFHFSNTEVTITDGYANFSFTGTQSTGITGEPAIPYQMVSLLIPQGHEAVSVNVEYLNEVYQSPKSILLQKMKLFTASTEYILQKPKAYSPPDSTQDTLLLPAQ